MIDLIPNVVVGLIFVVGTIVCLAGGLAITAFVVTFAIDRVLQATKTTNVVAQWWMAKKFPSRFKG